MRWIWAWIGGKLGVVVAILTTGTSLGSVRHGDFSIKWWQITPIILVTPHYCNKGYQKSWQKPQYY
jgi:hypothetical protein